MLKFHSQIPQEGCLTTAQSPQSQWEMTHGHTTEMSNYLLSIPSYCCSLGKAGKTEPGHSCSAGSGKLTRLPRANPESLGKAGSSSGLTRDFQSKEIGDDKHPLADGRWDSVRVWVRLMKYKLLNEEVEVGRDGFNVCVANPSGSAEKAGKAEQFGSNTLGECFTSSKGPKKGN